MKRKKKGFTYLMVLNTPKSITLNKLLRDFQTMINHPSDKIIFDSENKWCIIGLQTTRKNHFALNHIAHEMYHQPLRLPWLNLLYIVTDESGEFIKSIYLLNKCKIISSADEEYLNQIMKKPDPSLYYLRIKYKQVVDLSEIPDMLEDITRRFKHRGLL